MNLKFFLKPVIFFVLGNYFSVRIRFLWIKKRQRALVINLHKVNDSTSSAYRPLKVYLFTELIEFLNNHFKLIRFDQINFLDIKNTDRPIAIISFDDGYYDFLENVMPVVDRLQIPVNLNVIPGCIESGLPPLNVAVQDYIGSKPSNPDQMFEIIGFRPDQQYDLIFQGMQLSNFLKHKPYHQQLKIFDDLIKNMGDELYATSSKMLSLSDVLNIKSLVEIGAHSMDHANMAVESDYYVRNDLKASKNWFKVNLEYDVNVYAFPNNSYFQKHIKMAEQANFKYILTVNNNFMKIDGSEFDRFGVDAFSRSEVFYKSLGGWAKW